MKSKQVSYYLDLIKVALDSQDWVKAKRYGEIALKKLRELAYMPMDEYLLYTRTGNTYIHTGEYTKALDSFYMAELVSSKNKLGVHYVAYANFMLGGCFYFLRNMDQALLLFKKVEYYYDNYGDNKLPMDVQKLFNCLILQASCYLHKKDLVKTRIIIEEKAPRYLPLITTAKVFIRNYHQLKGNYLVEIKEYSQARQAMNESIKIGEQEKSHKGALESKIHLAGIDILEGNLNQAIKFLESLFAEAKRIKLNEYICRIGLLLSKCYALNNMPEKSSIIEAKIKSVLSKLDITWLYEQTREFEQFYKKQVNIYKNERYPVPLILADVIKKQEKESSGKNIIIGESSAIKEVYQLVTKISLTDLPVLIQGETGTGKELIARTIHQNSLRAERPWLAINCGAIPESLLENELFGHVKGAYTGAHEIKKGYIELASEGTLFLDEIDDMPLSMQQKLLRVLEEKLIWRVGAEKPIPVNTRFIFASNQNLNELMKAKRLREDLYYRINTIIIPIPPLRERKEDIPLLVDHFLTKYAPIKTPDAERITPNALALLQGYSWPGNIRELENEIKKICTLYPNTKTITKIMISDSIAEYSVPFQVKQSGFKELREEFERDLITETIKKCNGNLSDAARILKYDRAGLYKKIRQLGIANRIVT